MEAKFKLTILDMENDKIADVPEETLKYFEGVIEDAVENDRRVMRSILEDTDLGDGWEISATLDKGLLGNIFGE